MLTGNDAADRLAGQGAALAPVQDIRVSGRTASRDLATCARRYLSNGVKVRCIAIGIPAVNQAIKAVCILNELSAARGELYTVLPGFEDVEVCDEATGTQLGRTTTALTFTLIRYLF